MDKFIFKSFIFLLLYQCGTHADMKKSEENFNHHDYCVIGAGPAGLQMGYFLENAKRDYIIFEKGSGAGTFYLKYPIHRTLISINKRYTGKTNKEFNLRHDWNSLLSHDETLLMTKYTKEFFPQADVLVKYLNDFAKKLNLKIQHNTEIGNLYKNQQGVFEMNDQRNNSYTCQYVIVATGIATPNKPTFHGSEHVQGYEDLSLDLDEFEGQSIMILGRGNAAFEVAQHIMPATNVIHMMGRSRVKLAWATHYVGDLRAINDGLLDTYQLKSLDGLFEGPVEGLVLFKSPMDGRYYLSYESTVNSSPGGEEKNYFDNDPTREGYDRVISCLGFTFDDSLFHENMTLRRAKGRRKKYPLIKFSYEAFEIANLYFAGANTHSLDFRKSAGAFIHGYRYTTRTLHRLLEWKNHGVKWPYVHFSNIVDLVPHILKRLNEASDIYQMFGVLCDVVIYNEDRTEATYLEAFPCPLASRVPRSTGHSVDGAYMFIALEYGKNFSGPGKDPFFEERASGEVIEGHGSNFLHPVLYHYERFITDKEFIARPNKWILPIPDRIHHIVEDFNTKFDAPDTHILPLRRFVEQNTGHDLRFFFAEQCMALALTTKSSPLGCRGNRLDGNQVGLNENLAKHLSALSPHVLPFQLLNVNQI